VNGGALVGRAVLASLGERARAVVEADASKALVLADRRLPPGLRRAAVASLRRARFSVFVQPVSGGEGIKSLAAVERLARVMAAHRHGRNDPVVALGGGSVTDLAGFVSAAYHRGTPWVACPTTLLAMVDASIGGKTGVNLTLGRGGLVLKNALGAFHQPILVLADLAALDSLPERQFRAGLAECLKHGLIGSAGGDRGLWGWTLANLPRVLERRPAPLAALIRRNIAVKERVVSRDEHERDETGGRALLNLGHTFAHAIEALAGRGGGERIAHGEAVGLGLIAAARCAGRLGIAPAGIETEVRRALAACGLPTMLRRLPPTERVIAAMRHDKKARGGGLRLVLPTGGGRAAVVEGVPVRAAAAGVDSLRPV
jgi:3-dehydroquinate synthetase